jgi:hypothetical protein
MKLLATKSFSQSYSYYDGPKPSKVWVIGVADPAGFEMSQGISHDVLEEVFKHSEDWAGWGFVEGKAWLLFATKSDAMYAKMMFGDGK